jgi:hypothetical protein
MKCGNKKPASFSGRFFKLDVLIEHLERSSKVMTDTVALNVPDLCAGFIAAVQRPKKAPSL